MLDVVLSNRFKKDLKLAAKSLFGHLEPHRFLHSFAGSLVFGGILRYTLARGFRQSAGIGAFSSGDGSTGSFHKAIWQSTP